MPVTMMLECECGCRKFRRESIDVVEIVDIGETLSDELVNEPSVDMSTSFSCLNCGKMYGDDLSGLKRATVVK